MDAKKMLLAAAGTIALVGYTSTGMATGIFTGWLEPPAPLEGTWVVTIRPVVCSGPSAGTDVPGITPVVSHLTFGRGGTLIEATSNPNFGAGKRGPGHGWWDRTGRTSYQFAMQAFLLEPSAPYKTGLQRIDQTLELHTWDEWTSSGPVQFFDTFDRSTTPGLAPYRAGCARANGARLY